MKQTPTLSRYSILWMIIICYLLPLISLCTYSIFNTQWDVLAFGLLLTACGTLALFIIMARWESGWQALLKGSPEKQVDALTANSSQETLADLPRQPIDGSVEIVARGSLALTKKEFADLQTAQKGLEAELAELKTEQQQLALEKQQLIAQEQKTLADWKAFKESSFLQMERQQGHIQDLQETIAEQKAFIDKKQQQTGVLESKVGDLTYEIKTLLQLAEAHSGSLYADAPPSVTSSSHIADFHYEEPLSPPPERQIRTSDEASLQLKRCLDIAQKITGSQRFNTQFNALIDSPADSFALDLRRLCDSLRSENNSTILLYSPKENQLLFANNQAKILTGWSPDKFVQNFIDIIQDESAWRQGITSLAMRSEAQIQLHLKTKSGNDIAVHCHLGMIPTGIFRHHAIAVLYHTR